METLNPLGNLSVLPRELRDEIYAYLFPVAYAARWHTLLDREVPAFGKPQYLKVPWSAPGFNNAILRSSKLIHEEAVMVLYSHGIFRFASPYYVISDIPNASMKNRIMNVFGISLPSRHHPMGAFPDTSITSRIMNVELSYNLDLDCILSRDTERARKFNPTTSFCSASPDPVALFGGNSVQRKHMLIKFRMSEPSSYPTDITSSPLFDVLTQLTGFRTFTLQLLVWKQWTNNQHMEKDYPWQNLCAGLERLLNELTVALEPTLGTGAMSKLDINESWCMGRRSRQVVFHPRDHLAKTSKARNTVTQEAGQFMGDEPQ